MARLVDSSVFDAVVPFRDYTLHTRKRTFAFILDVFVYRRVVVGPCGRGEMGTVMTSMVSAVFVRHDSVLLTFVWAEALKVTRETLMAWKSLWCENKVFAFRVPIHGPLVRTVEAIRSVLGLPRYVPGCGGGLSLGSLVDSRAGLPGPVLGP